MSGVLKSKIRVVPFETQIYEDAPIAKECPKNRFFYPATFESVYKNQECIYKAIDILEGRGITDYQVVLTLPTDRQPKRSQIVHYGMLSREELYQAYADNVLIFPSYIETIGLPLLEAQNTNTMILAADCPYSREVLEKYKNAHFFSPFQPQELADLMQKAIMGELPFFPSDNNENEIHQNYHTWDVVLDNI